MRRADHGDDPSHELPHLGIRRLRPGHEPVTETLILLAQETLETSALLRAQIGIAAIEEAVQEMIQLEHPTPALPAKTPE
jgi:hypothetical protein